MTRNLLAALLCTCLTAPAALADRIQADAPVTRVTIFGEGAQITRTVTLAAPAGVHEVILPGLPAGIDPNSLRISATGATLGSVALQQGRALPADMPDTAAMQAARDEVRDLEQALRERDAATNAIRAEAEAANDTINFLRDLAKTDGAASGDVTALAQSVQAQILAARRTAIWADLEAQKSQRGREENLRRLEAARARLAALETPQDEGLETLVLTVETGQDPASIEITSFNYQAYWQPVYDLRLDRAAGTLTLDRGVVVAQSTGEDWDGVTLTLSTARPSSQSAPTEVNPQIARLSSPDEIRRGAQASSPRMKAEADAGYVPAVVEVEPVIMGVPRMQQLGLNVAYSYPMPVQIRDGVDAMRLSLDEKVLTPDIRAEAAPRYDSTAFLMADGANTLEEPILPGPATLYADGAAVGNTDLPLIAAGDDLRVGFGPIDGLTVERRIPAKSEGDRGFISRSNELEETSLLVLRNVTNEEWDLRVTDFVPTSEQEDLEIDWTANPEPTREAPDDKRGVLEWDRTIAPGEEQTITVDLTMRWPEGLNITYGRRDPRRLASPVESVFR